MRAATARRLAPLISADSSSAGSIERNAAPISRKAIGDWCSPSTSTMPAIE